MRNESDIYLLILGGRYGSIDPVSGKSYTHLEYEYALEKSMPVFACVITEDAIEDKVKEYGTKAIEKNAPDKLREFRELATSKMVKFWSDSKDIKIAIGETISALSRKEDLIGWVRPHQEANMPALLDEITRLSKENSDLRQTLQQFKSDTPNDLSFGDIELLLKADGVFDYVVNNEELLMSYEQSIGELGAKARDKLWMYGMLEQHEKMRAYARLNDKGKAFLARLKVEKIRGARVESE